MLKNRLSMCGFQVMSCLLSLCTEFISSGIFFSSWLPCEFHLSFKSQLICHLFLSHPDPFLHVQASYSMFSVVFVLLLLLSCPVESDSVTPWTAARQSLYLHWKSPSAKQGASVLFILYHWILVRMNVLLSLWCRYWNSHDLAWVVCLRLFTQPMSRSEFESR